MGRIAVLLVAVAAALALAWFAARLPEPLPASTPPTAFSATRAMLEVEAISARPRPTGSPQARAVRDHLLRRLQALGASGQVQQATALAVPRPSANPNRIIVGGQVENVVGMLPGRDRILPAVLLMSHYDSVPGSPGAADDALGVAATLETLRALRAGPPLQRDLILLFTDGEEAGLLGARAFFAEHPLARRVGTVLNLEARGGSGPALMFETGRGNAGLTELFARTAPAPAASSLSRYVYERLPNDTDFTVPRDRGLAGLNFAVTADQQDYHSPSATPANLDRGSLQHMGEQALGMTRALATARAEPARSGDAVYFDVLGRGLVRYPPWGGWILLAIGAGLWGLGVVRARRGDGLRLGEIARGVAAFLFLLVVTALMLKLANAALGFEPGLLGLRRVLVQFDLYEAGVALLAGGTLLLAAAGLLRGARLVWALTLALGLACVGLGGPQVDTLALTGVGTVLALLAFRRRPCDSLSLYAGLAFAVLLLAAVAQALAPEVAFLLAWPGLIAAAGFAFVASDRRGFDGPGVWAAALLGLFSVAWLAGFGHLILVTLGAELPQALAPIVALSAVLLIPLLGPAAATPAARPTAMLLLALGVAALAAVAWREPWTPRSPRPTQAVYLADPARGRFLRFSALPELDPWSAAALRSGATAARRGAVPEAFAPEAWVAQAPRIAATPVAPALTRAADGRLLLTVPAWRGRELRLAFRSSAPLTAVTVQGRPVTAAVPANRETRLRWTGSGPLTIAMTPEGAGALRATAAVVADGWPADAPAPPPRPTGSAPWGASDSTITVGRLNARF